MSDRKFIYFETSGYHLYVPSLISFIFASDYRILTQSSLQKAHNNGLLHSNTNIFFGQTRRRKLEFEDETTRAWGYKHIFANCSSNTSFTCVLTGLGENFVKPFPNVNENLTMTWRETGQFVSDNILLLL